MTQKKLEMQRKKADLPHESFDLDCDGFISNTDLFLAKRFDIDKDGKLNKEEREAAKKAIDEGYKDQFMFGLERAHLVQSALVDYEDYGTTDAKLTITKSTTRPNERLKNLRVVQRDGKVIVGENFTPLAPPARATSAQGARTNTELKHMRKQESIKMMQQAYGDLQQPKNRATTAQARPQSV